MNPNKTKAPKIGIIGGGAVGLTYAALLGNLVRVVIKTRRQSQADQLKSEGLTITIDGVKERVGSIDASADFSILSDCDCIIVAVKSYDTASIAPELSKVIDSGVPVLTLQNGLQAYEILRRLLNNPDRVFAGVTYIGAIRTDDRSVRLGDNRRTVVDARATQLVETLRKTRFGVVASDNIRQSIWDKMMLNVGQNALSAVTNLSVGEMLVSEDCLDIANNLLGEFKQVAEAEGINFNYSLVDKLKDNWLGSKFYPSMWQDLHNGNGTEIEAINGAIVEIGKKRKIDTPYNCMITSLVKAREQSTAKEH